MNGGQAQRVPTPIWLDCDTGHDDAFAILLAGRHPQSQLLGISTVFGNAPVSNTTYNTSAILKAIGREDVPVYKGAPRPFCREVAHAADIHGESGLDGTTCLPQPDTPVNDRLAIDAMQEALSGTAAGTAWLVATGALTNIALLFALYPGLVDHIAGLSIMGGAFGDGFSSPDVLDDGNGRVGNWTRWAEFNIYIDPESAQSIFSNQALAKKTYLAPLDLTHQFVATKEVQHMLLQHKHAPPQGSRLYVRKLFVEILTFFAHTYADVFGLHDGPPLHDPLAVAMILEPDMFSTRGNERFVIDVVTGGAHGDSKEIRHWPSQCGRTIIRAIGDHGIMIPRSLDCRGVWRMIDESLTLAEG